VSARTASLRRRKLKELDCHSQVCTRAIARRGNVPAAAEVGWRVVGHGQRRLLLSLCVHLVSVSGSSTEEMARPRRSVCGGGRWGRVTGTGQVQSCLPVDDEELLLAGDAGAGVDEDPLVLLVVLVVGVCPVGRHVSDDRSRCSSWMAGSWRRGLVGLTGLTSPRRWCCHLSRQSRLCGLCSSRCGRCWVQSSQT
jgi:hypothetical protein